MHRRLPEYRAARRSARGLRAPHDRREAASGEVLPAHTPGTHRPRAASADDHERADRERVDRARAPPGGALVSLIGSRADMHSLLPRDDAKAVSIGVPDERAAAEGECAGTVHRTR